MRKLHIREDWVIRLSEFLKLFTPPKGFLSADHGPSSELCGSFFKNSSKVPLPDCRRTEPEYLETVLVVLAGAMGGSFVNLCP